MACPTSRRRASTAPRAALYRSDKSRFNSWLNTGGLHAAQFVLELLDLVPQPRRDLELQLGGGGVHLVGELLDERHQVAARRARVSRGRQGAGSGGARRATGRRPGP